MLSTRLLTRRAFARLCAGGAGAAIFGGATASSGKSAPALPDRLSPEHTAFRRGADFAEHVRNGIEPGQDFLTDGKQALIVPMAEGTVVQVLAHPLWNKLDPQFIAYIDHGGEKTTIYAHMKSVCVEPGDRVGRFSIIGTGGAVTLTPTGRWAPPHLHVGLYYAGYLKPFRPVEPSIR